MNKKSSITVFTVEEKLKARAFVEGINDNAVAFIVNHILTEHIQEFLPYTLKEEEVRQ